MADNDNNGNNGEALPSSLETYVAAVTPTTTPTDDDDPEGLLADHDFGADLRATIRSLLDEAHAAAAQETADDTASADGGGGAAVGALNVGNDGRTPSTHIAMSGGRTPATAADQVEAKAKRRLEAMVDRVAHLAAPPVGAIGSVGVPTTPGDSIEKAADADDLTRLRGLVEGIIDEEELPWELRANLKALRDSDYETFLDMPLNSVTLPSLINFLVVAQMAAGLEIDLGGSLPPVGGLVTGSADGGTAAAATTFWEASLRPDQAGDPQLDALRFRSVTVDGTITVGPHIDSLLGVDGAADPALILPGDHVYVHMHGYNNTEADVRGSFAGFNDALVDAGAPAGAKYIALQWNSAGSATAISADVICINAATPIFRAFLETLVAHVGDVGSVVCSAHSLGTLALGGFLSDDSAAPLGLRAAYFFAGAFPVATARSGMAAINKHAARSRNYHRNKTGRYVDWVILGAWVIFGGGVGINAVQKVEKKLSKRHSDDRHVFSDRLVDFWMWSSGHTYYADPRVASDVVAHWLAQ